MTIYKHLHPRDDVDKLYVSRKKRERGNLPALKTALTHQNNDSKTTLKRTVKDRLQLPEIIAATQGSTAEQ